MTELERASAFAMTIEDEFVDPWMARFLDGWHSSDPGLLPEMCTEDIVWEDPFIRPAGVANGKHEVRSWLASIFHAFPDLRFEVVGEPAITRDRQRLVAMWHGRGHLVGRLDPPGFGATMEVIEIDGVDFHSFAENGKLAHVQTIVNLNDVGVQIGAVPPAGSLRERAVIGMQRVEAWRRARKAVIEI